LVNAKVYACLWKPVEKPRGLLRFARSDKRENPRSDEKETLTVAGKRVAVTFHLSLRGRLFVSEAVSTVRLLRAFAPRKDKQKRVTARSSYRFRSSLALCPHAGHCELVVSFAKQSQSRIASGASPPRNDLGEATASLTFFVWRSSPVRLLRFARSDKKGEAVSA